jgi:hypothetical protein
MLDHAESLIDERCANPDGVAPGLACARRRSLASSASSKRMDKGEVM